MMFETRSGVAIEETHVTTAADPTVAMAAVLLEFIGAVDCQR